MKNTFVAILLGLLIACSPSSQKLELDEVKIMLSWFPGAENGFLYYGVENGIFEKNGIKLNIIPSKGSSIVSLAINSGEADFGFVSSDYLLLARSKSLDIVALLTLYYQSPVTIYSLKEKSITHPDSLIGKKLGILTKSSTYPQVIGFLSHMGLEENKDYESINSNGSTIELTNELVDAQMNFTNYGPAEMVGKLNKEINEIHISDFFELYGTSIATSSKVIRKNRELVQRFTSAMLESLNASLQNRSGTLESLLKYNVELDKDEMDVALKKTNQMILELKDSMLAGEMNMNGWETTLKNLNTLQNDSLTLDLTQTFDDSFYKNYYSK